MKRHHSATEKKKGDLNSGYLWCREANTAKPEAKVTPCEGLAEQDKKEEKQKKRPNK